MRQGRPGPLLQRVRAFLGQAPGPRVERRSGDPVVAARGRDVAADLLSVTQDGQPGADLTVRMWIAHVHSVVSGAPNCQACTSVSYSRRHPRQHFKALALQVVSELRQCHQGACNVAGDNSAKTANIRIGRFLVDIRSEICVQHPEG